MEDEILELTAGFFEQVRNNNEKAQHQLAQWTRTFVIGYVDEYFKSCAGNADEIAGDVVRKVVQHVINHGLDCTRPLRKEKSGRMSSPHEHYKAFVVDATKKIVKAQFSNKWDTLRWWPPASSESGLPDEIRCVFPEPTDKEKEETRRRLYACIQRLSPRDRKIIQIWMEEIGEGKVTTRLAESLQIEEKGVGAAVKRAMDRLRRICEQKGSKADWLAVPKEPWEATISGRFRRQASPDQEKETEDEGIVDTVSQDEEGG